MKYHGAGAGGPSKIELICLADASLNMRIFVTSVAAVRAPITKSPTRPHCKSDKDNGSIRLERRKANETQ